MYTVVAIIYPSANPSSGCFRKSSIYATGHGYCGSGRYESFGGRGRGRRKLGICVLGIGVNGRGYLWGGSGTYENGIDISYVTCYFEDSEWAVIENDTRKRITEEPVRTKLLSI